MPARPLVAMAVAGAVTVAAVVGVAFTLGEEDPGSAPAAARSSLTASATPSTPAPPRTPPARPRTPPSQLPSPALVPEPSPPDPPATTSLTLTGDDLPQAAALRGGWAPYEDPGGVEAGFDGNGSWVRARDPAELAAGLRPIGCAAASEPPALPEPTAALEGTYVSERGEGRGVSVVMDYPDVASAQRFLTVLGRIVRDCAEPPGGVRASDPLTLVIEPLTVTAEEVVDVRRERGVDASPLTWTEVAIRDGSRIGLLALGVEEDAPPPEPAALARALRDALGGG